MPEGARTIEGRCLCGAISYRAEAEPAMQGICHCTDCQQQSGTAFSAFVAVPRDSLVVEGDTLSSYTTVGEAHGTDTERCFCSRCGSPIVSYVAVVPELAFVKAGTLGDPSWLEPDIELWTRSSHPWSPHFEGATSFEQSIGPADAG